VLCRVIITNQALVDREESSYYYLPLIPRVSLPPPPQSAVQVSMSMEVSRLPTLRSTTATHSTRCLEAFHCSSAVRGLVVNCNVGKRTPLALCAFLSRFKSVYVRSSDELSYWMTLAPEILLLHPRFPSQFDPVNTLGSCARYGRYDSKASTYHIDTYRE